VRLRIGQIKKRNIVEGVALNKYELLAKSLTRHHYAESCDKKTDFTIFWEAFMGQYTVGIDLGGTKLLTALIDGEWKIQAITKIKTQAELGVDYVNNLIVSSVKQLLENYHLTAQEIRAVGIGVPGMVDSVEGIVLSAPNLTGWQNIRIVEILSHKLEIPVVAGNDVNVGLLGESQFGAAKGYKDVVGVFVGTGIGGAVMIDGKIVNGAHHLAGEIGHIVIDKHEKSLRCGCGKLGCLEASAGRVGMAKQIAAKAKKGKPSILAEAAKKDVLKIKSGKLKKAVQANDDLGVEIVKKSAEEIGIAIANLINILDPELIVLGGGVIEALSDFMLPIIHKSVKHNTINYHVRNTNIVISQLGDHATVMGAAYHALSRIEKNVQSEQSNASDQVTLSP
jgi:glucokinase